MEAAIVKHRRPYRISTVFHIIGVSWASASFGYSGSIIGTTLGQPSFLAYMGLDTNPNATQLIGAMNALFYTGGFFGCFMVGYFADKYGRKAVLAGGVSLILVSNALLAGSVNIAMFIVFRFFCGMG
jgi:MFS family permease